MRHWAAGLIGRPWQQVVFDCWEMVRYVFATQRQIVLPLLAVSEANGHDIVALKATAQGAGWVRVDGPPQAWDVVLMRRWSDRGLHVGVMIEADGKLGLLHCDGAMTPRGPVGGVVFQQLQHVAQNYRELEYWRLAP